MEYNRSSRSEKWTIMMYMRNFDLMVDYAYALRASNELSNDNIDDILLQMERDGIYHPRNGGSTFTGQFKSIQVAWYMFGYYNKARKRGEPKKMVFTPLGNLLLDNLDDKEKVSKIFLTMLFGNGFHQPFSRMDSRFNIYPFRLIFKLLRDPRLGGKLYNDEVFYFVMFMKKIDPDSYEELVSDILTFRQKNPDEKFQLFKDDEKVVGLALHEWRYATGLMESAGIVNIHNDHNNRVIGNLNYGNISPITGRPNAVRHYVEDYIELKDVLIPLVDKLLASYSYDAEPYPEDELEARFSNDFVVEMYSFYPPELLEELEMITETDAALTYMLNIARDVNYYSHNETGTGKKFEDVLADAFNMFIDVETEGIGNAGTTDVECVYTLPVEEVSKKKFDVEAKARRTKLTDINQRRLRQHRIAIGSEYTIIVAPNFSIGVVKTDISSDASVVCKAATLSNFLYQYIIKMGRNISYTDLDLIVTNNLGSDITDLINNYVYNNFGHDANDLKI